MQYWHNGRTWNHAGHAANTSVLLRAWIMNARHPFPALPCLYKWRQTATEIWDKVDWEYRGRLSTILHIPIPEADKFATPPMELVRRRHKILDIASHRSSSATAWSLDYFYWRILLFLHSLASKKTYIRSQRISVILSSASFLEYSNTYFPIQMHLTNKYRSCTHSTGLHTSKVNMDLSNKRLKTSLLKVEGKEK